MKEFEEWWETYVTEYRYIPSLEDAFKAGYKAGQDEMLDKLAQKEREAEELKDSGFDW